MHCNFTNVEFPFTVWKPGGLKPTAHCTLRQDAEDIAELANDRLELDQELASQDEVHAQLLSEYTGLEELIDVLIVELGLGPRFEVNADSEEDVGVRQRLKVVVDVVKERLRPS